MLHEQHHNDELSDLGMTRKQGTKHTIEMMAGYDTPFNVYFIKFTLFTEHQIQIL